MFEKFSTPISFNNLLDSKFDWKLIPAIKGVYIVSCPSDFLPQFLEKGSGGFFKGKNPNKEITDLSNKWVKNANIIYIGKAGGLNQKSTLRSRIKQYIKFGLGNNNVAHYGGRYIWQLNHIKQLYISWYLCDLEEPIDLEKQLLQQFKEKHHNLPFANLKI